MRFVYSVPSGLDRLPRAYVRLRVNDVEMPALIDTGADVSVLPEQVARAAGIEYETIAGAIGIAGLVPAFQVRRPIVVTLLAPHRQRRGIDWTAVGSYRVRPIVVRSSVPMPALIGRTDLLVRYRFTLVEARQIFELTEVA